MFEKDDVFEKLVVIAQLQLLGCYASLNDPAFLLDELMRKEIPDDDPFLFDLQRNAIEDCFAAKFDVPDRAQKWYSDVREGRIQRPVGKGRPKSGIGKDLMAAAITLASMKPIATDRVAALYSSSGRMKTFTLADVVHEACKREGINPAPSVHSIVKTYKELYGKPGKNRG